jgi:hypothetical protein
MFDFTCWLILLQLDRARNMTVHKCKLRRACVSLQFCGSRSTGAKELLCLCRNLKCSSPLLSFSWINLV